MTGKVPLSDLMSEYTLPPQMREKIEQAFKGFDANRIIYMQEQQPSVFFSRGTDAHKERTYRALSAYAAQMVSGLFENAEGKRLYDKLVEVMTETENGVLLKGLPEDPACKCLFVLGVKTLAGDNEGVHDYFRPGLPDIITRHPQIAYNFHHDGNPDLEGPEKRSFLFMGIAQDQKLNTPTLVKLADSPDKEHAEIYFAPDELAFFNNKKFKHSTGLQSKNSKPFEERKLFRYTVDCTKGSHSLLHSHYVNELMNEDDVPQESQALKKWLIHELRKLKYIEERKGLL